MITGFNTDIDHAGKVFHIQTEDKGLDNPVVESLIYCGGEIITSRRSSYGDLAEAGFSEEQLLQRMEAQHQMLIREIRNGRFDSDGQMPFGYEIVSNRSFDELVVEFLSTLAEPATTIALKFLDDQTFSHGTRPTVRMEVQQPETRDPIPDALVTIFLAVGDEPPFELFSAHSDTDGFVEASFEIPELAGQVAELVCQAQVQDRTTELRQQVSVASVTETSTSA